MGKRRIQPLFLIAMIFRRQCVGVILQMIEHEEIAG